MNVQKIDTTELSAVVHAMLSNEKRLKNKIYLTILFTIFLFGVVAFDSNPSVQWNSHLSMPWSLIPYLGVVVFAAILAQITYGSTLSNLLINIFDSIAVAWGPTTYRQWSARDLHLGAVAVPGYTEKFNDILKTVDSYRAKSLGVHSPLRKERSAMAGVYFLVGIVSFVVLFVVLASNGFAAVGTTALGVGAVALGFFAIRRFRTHRQPSAEELLTTDSRPLVLWLRSFKDDAASVAGLEDNLAVQSILYSNLVSRSLEDYLVFDLRYYGPVVSIGEPGETLPRLGAARGYFDDSQWQEAVTHWMELAKIIIVVVGTSRWLHWEIDTAHAKGHAEKLLFVFPPATRADRVARWATVISATSDPQVREALSQIDVSAARAVHFRGADMVVAISDDSNDNVAYEVAARLAIYGMFCAR
jgi:hypothetical protein